ncbi:hypothetical protein ACFV2Q_27670 [Streptomyces sp. NPDC059650]|uniref:hypothetical protein n=1 Tax=Streptomyces sp. NPDC059650 TaxID=3346896 RepID=UPI00369D9546
MGGCAWCGAPLERPRARYCTAAHRQAAYRARRHADAAVRARVALYQVSGELLARSYALRMALDQIIGQRDPAPGMHTHMAADVQHLARELVRVAAIADRQAGATWSQIGDALGITADAARARYGHIRLITERPADTDDPTPPSRPTI